MATRAEAKELSSRPKPTARRGKHQTESSAKRTVERGADDFLKQQFEPVVGPRALINQENRESDFFKSLSWVCDAYNIPKVDTELPYPANVTWQINRVQNALDDADLGNYTVEVVQTDTSAASILIEHCVDTGTDLYFIPIKPIFDLRESGKVALADLLTSACAYLRSVVKVSYYTDDAYVAYEYIRQIDQCDESMIQDDVDADEIADLKLKKKVAQKAISDGKKYLTKLSQKKTLSSWKQRLADFTPADLWEADVKQTINKLFDLYTQYPKRTIEDALGHNLDIDDDEINEHGQPEGLIGVDSYVSFIWDFDELIDEAIDMLNQCEYANCSGIYEPRSETLFDESDPNATHDLYFDFKLFTLMDELICHLRTDQ